jgi:hypothetical protein
MSHPLNRSAFSGLYRNDGIHDAATYITELPKKKAAEPEGQTAIETLMRAAERGGPTMLPRIGIMRALNRGHVREFNPAQGSSLGRRKLKRDQ